MNDVTILHVPAGTKLERPPHLDLPQHRRCAAQASFARVLVVVEAGASVTLVETHDGPAGVAYQANTLVEIDAGDGARINHIRNNNAGNAALGLSTLGAPARRDTRFSSFSMNIGGAMSRHQIFVALNGKDSELALQARVAVARPPACRHHDGDRSTPSVTASAASCSSRCSTMKAARVFQGKIIVRPHAQKTDGKMALACAAAVGRGRSRSQAGTGNLRRRRGLRPWRHRRCAR